MILSHLLSQLANARLSAAQRQLLRGRGVIALEAVGVRLCFRLDESGRLSPISPLVAADVTAQWRQDGSLQVSGDANLLRDAGDVWEQTRPRWDDFLTQLPGGTNGTAATCLCRLRRQLSESVNFFAPSSAAVAGFNQQTQSVAQRCRRLTHAVQELESAHV